jgi:hypothetical protein
MKKLFTLAFIFVLGLSAAANDTSGRVLPTGDIQFTKQEDVEMVQESLYLSPNEIEVNYLFKNTTDKDIKAEVFFPIPNYNGYSTFGNKGIDFKAYLNGKNIQYKKDKRYIVEDMDITKEIQFLLEEYDRSFAQINWIGHAGSCERCENGVCKGVKECHEQVQDLSQKMIDIINGFQLPDNIKAKLLSTLNVWVYEEGGSLVEYIEKVSFYWEQTFPAGKIVHIKHTYKPSVFSSSMGDTAFGYILKTGANWKGPIKQFNLLSQINGKSCLVNTDRYEDRDEKRKIREVYSDWLKETDEYLVKDIRNFIPVEDLSIDCKGEGMPDENPIGVCNYKEGCTLYEGKSKEPLCRFKREKEKEDSYDVPPLISRKKDITTYFPYGDHKFFKIDKKTDENNNHPYFRGLKIILTKSTKAEQKLPLCSDIKYLTPVLYKIDGPANIRVVPNGKILISAPNDVYVWKTAELGNWAEVIYGETKGWTHKQNLIDIWKEFDR